MIIALDYSDRVCAAVLKVPSTTCASSDEPCVPDAIRLPLPSPLETPWGRIAPTPPDGKKKAPIAVKEAWNSPGWTRTSNLAVNSRSLYQLSYRGLSCQTGKDTHLSSSVKAFESLRIALARIFP